MLNILKALGHLTMTGDTQSHSLQQTATDSGTNLPESASVSLNVVESGSLSESVLVNLAKFINAIYTEAEAGMWEGSVHRATCGSLKALIADDALIIAKRGSKIVGCVALTCENETSFEFGMLAVAKSERGNGVGRRLVEFSQRQACNRGASHMRLRLVVPRDWQQPHKEFLKKWYPKLGFEANGEETFAPDGLEDTLATPVRCLVYQKTLKLTAQQTNEQSNSVVLDSKRASHKNGESTTLDNQFSGGQHEPRI